MPVHASPAPPVAHSIPIDSGVSRHESEHVVITIGRAATIRCMDPNQSKIIELLREVHAITVKEIERLNLRIAELESRDRELTHRPIEKATVKPTERPATNTPPSPKRSSVSDQPEMLNEMQVAKWLNLSVASVRRWRLFRKGPKYLKLGSAVRYRRGDLETWLKSCPWLR